MFHAVMVILDWSMVLVNMMDALKYATLASGELSVMIYLEILMHKWLVDN